MFFSIVLIGQTDDVGYSGMMETGTAAHALWAD